MGEEEYNLFLVLQTTICINVTNFKARQFLKEARKAGCSMIRMYML